ncbi:MAG TPA: histidine phosphatase family protein [Rhodobacteraceae bacterium]|nr:histidine phosphatase family protein [Paracoccaceae bacterium]
MAKFPELFILRHGQTEWNVLGKYQGHMDSPLTKLGLAQARSQGEILRAHVASRKLQAYASPLLRAARTAEIALMPLGQQARLDSRLKEVSFGTREGKTRAEIAEIDESSRVSKFERYFSDPKGEDFQDIASRCRAFLESLSAPSILITHGITSRILRGLWLGIAPEAMLELPVGQGCVYHLSAEAEHCLQAAPANAALPTK